MNARPRAIGEAATALHDDGKVPEELAAARAVLTDAQFSALQWCAITMNAFNRVSVLSGHPASPRTTGAGTSRGMPRSASQEATGTLP